MHDEREDNYCYHERISNIPQILGRHWWIKTRPAMENQAAMEQQSYEDVQKSGYLRKQKSMHRRFFVLRAASEQGPARLEYYENEKKFRSKSPVPKKAVNLDSCFNINKRADSKNKHMIVLYTRGESFAVAADTEDVQNEWYQAMLDLQCKCESNS